MEYLKGVELRQLPGQQPVDPIANRNVYPTVQENRQPVMAGSTLLIPMKRLQLQANPVRSLRCSACCLCSCDNTNAISIPILERNFDRQEPFDRFGIGDAVL